MEQHLTKAERTLLELFQGIVDEMSSVASDFPKFLKKFDSGRRSLYSLYVPGRGPIMISEKTQWQFEAIAKLSLRRLGDEAIKFDRSDLVQLLKTEFVSKIDKGLSEDLAEEIVGNAINNARAQQLELTHFIPVVALVHRNPPEFRIGPVLFVLSDRFSEQYRAEIDEQINPQQVGVPQFEKLKTFYANHRWIAAVTVPPCSLKLSKLIAMQTTQRALDVLKLYCGAARGSKIRTAHDHGGPFQTSYLVRNALGKFSASWSEKLQDAVLAEDWHDVISRKREWAILSALLQRRHTSWGAIEEPRQRFLDALSWYGDAVSEPDAQSKVLKYWTTLERLVALKNNDPVERRVAILVSADETRFPETFKEIQTSYVYRSNIIHGSVAYEGFDEEKAFRLDGQTRSALFRYLALLESLEVSGDMSKRGLQSIFEQLDTQSRKVNC